MSLSPSASLTRLGDEGERERERERIREGESYANISSGHSQKQCAFPAGLPSFPPFPFRCRGRGRGRGVVLVWGLSSPSVNTDCSRKEILERGEKEGHNRPSIFDPGEHDCDEDDDDGGGVSEEIEQDESKAKRRASWADRPTQPNPRR